MPIVQQQREGHALYMINSRLDACCPTGDGTSCQLVLDSDCIPFLSRTCWFCFGLGHCEPLSGDERKVATRSIQALCRALKIDGVRRIDLLAVGDDALKVCNAIQEDHVETIALPHFYSWARKGTDERLGFEDLVEGLSRTLRESFAGALADSIGLDDYGTCLLPVISSLPFLTRCFGFCFFICR